MGNTTKTYTIEISLDSAKQSLDDATKRLQLLDAKLNGLDRNSAEAKAIVAEMGKLAKQAEQAEAEIGRLNGRLDGLKPGTIGALKQEFRDLTKELNNTVEGSEEANRVLLRMGEVKGSIKGLRDEVKSLDGELRINAFATFTQGIIGAAAVAGVAAETFGLSSQSAEEFTKRTQGVIATLSGLDAIRQSLDGETIKSIKSTLALGKAYILGAESASTGAKITRAALISTGIGAAVVLVGLLVSNFDKVKEVGSSIYAKFKPQFEAIASLVNSIADSARNLASAVTFGLIDDVAKHAVAVAKETADKLLGVQTEAQEREIALRKAQGLRTEQIELSRLENLVKIAREKAKSGDEEKLRDLAKAENEFAVLKATLVTKQFAEEDAIRLARLNASLALQKAKGKQAFAEELAVKQEELTQLMAAETRNESAVIAKQAEIESLFAAKRKAQHEKDIAEEFARFKARNKALERIGSISAQDRLRLDLVAEQKRQDEIAKLGQQMSAAAGKVAEQLAADQAERIRIAGIAPLSVGENILAKVFGVDPKDLDETKRRIAAAVDAVNQAVGQYYAGALSEADARVEDASQHVSLLNQALDQNRKKQQDDEKALAGATGARRDYLLQKIAKERQEEERLNVAKNKAAADEKKRLKEQMQLQKEAQRVSLVLTAANAIGAAVQAIANAAALPFPANIPAIIIAGATTASAIFSAKALGNAFADGGFVTGPGGPRSDEVPAVLSNGEFVVNADATAKNRNLLEMMNANNNRVLPPGTLGLAAGAGGGSQDGSGASSADFQQLIAQQQQLIGLTQQLIGHAATTAAKPPLIIGPAEAAQIEEQRQLPLTAKASATL